MKKNARFNWGPCQEITLQTFKECLINASILAIPIDGGSFVLDTDAINYSTGCVLQQMQNDELKVIGYSNKTFMDAELRYCTTHCKLVAIIYGMKYYWHFQLGFPFVLRTDHAALTHLLQAAHPVAQSAPYLDTLAEYQFTVQYQLGLVHRNADALSRHPSNCEPDAPPCR